jgi:hypothetical protein
MSPNPQESNTDQDAHYRNYFFTWPGMFHLYQEHPGFNTWFQERELGCKRRKVDTSPDFNEWVQGRIVDEYPFIEN